MKGKEGKGGAPSAELLVCFPSRATLTLMPKPTSSPSRHHHQKKFSGAGGDRAYSPTRWAKPRPMGSDSSEPNSPKVTCAGQIKVSSKTKRRSSPCKNWQSVMEEIEKLHNHKKHKKRLNWVEALGIKKDIMQFLTCLQSLKFDFRCFGSVPNSDILSDDEEEEEEEEEDEEEGIGGIDEGDDESSRTVFSKWFMVLQENQNRGFEEQEQEEEEPCAPPSNALLLMRCRSAPAKSWLEEREEEEEEERRMEEEEEEEEKRKKGDEGGLMVMGLGYDSDFYKISSDIAKETWVVGGIRDLLSRSKSSKR